MAALGLDSHCHYWAGGGYIPKDTGYMGFPGDFIFSYSTNQKLKIIKHHRQEESQGVVSLKVSPEAGYSPVNRVQTELKTSAPASVIYLQCEA